MGKKSSVAFWLIAILIAGCAGSSKPDEQKSEPKSTEGAKQPISHESDLLSGIRREVLPNGMVVILKEDHRLPIVATALGYKVGSVYETEDNTGLAHYLEHMMFKGTDKYALGEIDHVTQRAGGENNAFTTNDMTVYWFKFNSECLDEFLQLEANRMTKCSLDPVEFEHEKKVVKEELNHSLDTPWGPLQQEVEKRAFPKSGYRHPVLGWREQLDKMTRESMADFYRRYYQPDNAILVVVGDFKSGDCLDRVKKYFSPLPAKQSFAPARADEPPQDKEQRFEVSNEYTTSYLLMAYRGVTVGSSGDFALDVLSTILSTGRKSRLTDRLVEKEHLASDGGVATSNDARRYDGLFTVQVELKPDAKPEDAEKVVLEELAKVQEKPVSEEELRRAKSIVRSNFAFGKETSINMAQSIAQYEVLGIPNYLQEYMGRIDSITAKNLMDVARTVFRPDRRTLGISRPKKNEGDHGYLPRSSRSARSMPSANRKGASFLSDMQIESRDWDRLCDDAARRSPAGGGPDIGEFWQVRLENGLTLLLKRKADVPVVALHAYVRAGQMFEPEEKAGLAALVGNMLDEGTWNPETRKRLSYDEIAALIENVGGQLSTGAGGLNVKVLSEHREIAYDLARELLLYAEMPEKRFRQVRQRILDDIETSKNDPQTVARKLFYETVYKSHPLHRPSEGYKETVEKLTREDALAHYRRFFRPDNTILAVVGDIDPARTLQDLKKRFEGWKAEGPLDLPKIPQIQRQTEPRFAFEFRNILQANIYLGHLGVERLNPDYATLDVMQSILCTAPGFTDRLSKAVREKEGLAYTVGGSIINGASEIPAPFIIYLGTQASQKDHALSVTMTQIRKFLEEGPTQAEVEDTKLYLSRSVVFGWETNEGLASYLIELRRFNLPPDDVRRFTAAVHAVTKEDIQRAAQKYIDVKNMSLVIVGPVDKDGKVIKTNGEKEKEKDK